MSWLWRHHAETAEALDLELAGTPTGSAVAVELLAAAEALRRTAATVPLPRQLEARRTELVQIGVAATGARLARRQILRPLLIAGVLAILLAAAALGAALVNSWLQSGPPPQPGAGSAVTVQADPSAAAASLSGSAPATEPRAVAGTGCEPSRRTTILDAPGGVSACEPGAVAALPGVLPAATVEQLTERLLRMLAAACGEASTLPALDGADEATATALVEELVAACEAAVGSSLPDNQPDDTVDQLAAELLVAVREACGEDAALPDLDGLDETAARALIETTIAACQEASTTPSLTLAPEEPGGELTAELLAALRSACGKDAELPSLQGLDKTAARELVDTMVSACEATTITPLP
jgi:hypothetical protein